MAGLDVGLGAAGDRLLSEAKVVMMIVADREPAARCEARPV
jgi:hypothetical protein